MKLSLIIPTYNRAALLAETLQSGLRQTREPDEIIIVDDGSTDDTRQMVERFGARVRYHYQVNAGLAAARTMGMTLSSGDLLCFLDSDDLLLPGALKALEGALLAAPEAALAYCRSQTIDASGHVVEERWWKEDHVGDAWKHMIDGNFIRSTGCALIRRSSLEQVEPWDQEMRAIEDWDLWVRLAETAPFVRVDDALFQYRVHGTNMSGDQFRMHRQTFRLLRKHRDRNRNHPERLAYLRAARARAREAVARECFRLAGEAQRERNDRLALLELVRAVWLRPRYLLERQYLGRLLGTVRNLCGVGRAPAQRGML